MALRHDDGARDISRFNRICWAIALLWLIIVPPLRHATYQDMAAFYLAGVVAHTGAWSSLYPEPVGQSNYYIGEEGHYRQKPGLAKIIADRNVQEWCPCVNPPWQAVALLPLGWLTFREAHFALIFFSGLCMWGVAIAGGRGYELCTGRRSRISGLITLLIAFSMLAYRAIRVQNLSTIVALCIAITVWDLIGRLGRSGFWGGFAAAWGALAKVATFVLLPLALVTRRWQTIFWAAFFFVLAIVMTWIMAGSATFHEFFGVIAPSLGGSTVNPGNKSLQGFLLRITGHAPLTPALAAGFRFLQLIVAALILWLFILPRPGGWRRYWLSPIHIFAGATALVSWLLIFSPLCWEHYFVYLCPFWGWMIWEATLSKARFIAIFAAILMHWFPLPVLLWLHVPEPINSYMLLGLIIMFVLAINRLSISPSTHTANHLRVSNA